MLVRRLPRLFAGDDTVGADSVANNRGDIPCIIFENHIYAALLLIYDNIQCLPILLVFYILLLLLLLWWYGSYSDCLKYLPGVILLPVRLLTLV